MKTLVTGGAGFIGSNLVKHLIKKKYSVTVLDNFSTGKIENIKDIKDSIKLYQNDLLDKNLPKEIFKDIDIVFHMAANADVRDGFKEPFKDAEQNIIATINLAEQCKNNNINKIFFASTAAMLAEPDIFPTPENIAIPNQTSLYGTSKLAAEGILSSYNAKYGFNVGILRFVSVVGDFYSHGHIYDFYKKLIDDKNILHILGDGKQRKSYLHILDILSGIDVITKEIFNKNNFFEIYNIGNNNYCTVTESAERIINTLNLSPEFKYSGGERGWVGDSPFVFLDTSKLKKLGWNPKIEALDAIQQTVEWLKQNEWIFDEKG